MGPHHLPRHSSDEKCKEDSLGCPLLWNVKKQKRWLENPVRLWNVKNRLSGIGGKTPIRRDAHADGLLAGIDLGVRGLSHHLRGIHGSGRRIGRATTNTEVHEWTERSPCGLGRDLGVRTCLRYCISKCLLTGSVSIACVEVERGYHIGAVCERRIENLSDLREVVYVRQDGIRYSVAGQSWGPIRIVAVLRVHAVARCGELFVRQ